MQGSEQNIWTFPRCIQHAGLLLLLGSLLSGCLPGVPGIGWGDERPITPLLPIPSCRGT